MCIPNQAAQVCISRKIRVFVDPPVHSLFSVKDEKKKLEADLESCKKQGQDFIQYVMNDMKKRKEKFISERDFYVAKYEADCKKMSQTLKEGIVKAERALKKLDE